MNCSSQDPRASLLYRCSFALYTAWPLRGPMRGGGPGSSLALCVCSGSDQVSWHRPLLPIRVLRKACLFAIWACGTKETMSAVSTVSVRTGEGEQRVRAQAVQSTRVLISSVFMSTHYRKHRCPSDGTVQTGVGGTLSPHWKCVHTFSIKNTFSEQVGSIKQNYFRLS